MRITFAGSIASLRLSVTQKSRSASQALQVVHPVGHGAETGFGSASRWKFQAARAPAPARQQPRVGVQNRLVGLVGDRAEQLVLALAGVAQQRERLVGVGGDHDLVEALASRPPRPRRRQLDVVRGSRAIERDR